jgi:hypothetical protein
VTPEKDPLKRIRYDPLKISSKKNRLIYINDRPAGFKEMYELALGGYIRDLYLFQVFS